MTYNPNSAFPRQATYVSGFHHQIRTQQAINEPNFNPKGFGGVTIRSLAGDYANIGRQAGAQVTGWGIGQAASEVANRPGIVQAIRGHARSMDALKRANEERGEQRMQDRMTQHYPPQADEAVRVGDLAGDVLANKPKNFETPIETKVPGFEKVPGFNENLTAPRPMRGRRIKVSPDQTQLF